MQQGYMASRQREKLCLKTAGTFPSSQANCKAGYPHLLPSTSCFLITVLHCEVWMYDLSKATVSPP